MIDHDAWKRALFDRVHLSTALVGLQVFMCVRPSLSCTPGPAPCLIIDAGLAYFLSTAFTHNKRLTTTSIQLSLFYQVIQHIGYLRDRSNLKERLRLD